MNGEAPEDPPEEEPQILPPIINENLDHTVDVRIHTWGDNLAEAFEQCAMGLFGYITYIEQVDNFRSEQIETSSHDMLSLLYGFLDEWLFVFNADPFLWRELVEPISAFNPANVKISATGFGQIFNLAKHTHGTKVKTITYSNMQLNEKDDYAEVFVTIDI